MTMSITLGVDLSTISTRGMEKEADIDRDDHADPFKEEIGLWLLLLTMWIVPIPELDLDLSEPLITWYSVSICVNSDKTSHPDALTRPVSPQISRIFLDLNLTERQVILGCPSTGNYICWRIFVL